MKIRNEQGIEIIIPKNLQNKVKRAIQNGKDIDSLIKPLMKNGGKLPKADNGLITDDTLQNSLGQPLNLNQNNAWNTQQNYQPYNPGMLDNTQGFNPDTGGNMGVGFNWNTPPNKFSNIVANRPQAPGTMGTPQYNIPENPYNTRGLYENKSQFRNTPLDDRYNSNDIFSGKTDLYQPYQSQQGSKGQSTQGQQGRWNLDSIFGPSNNKYFNRAAAFGNAAMASINGVKGILDNAGNSIRNNRTQWQEAQALSQGKRQFFEDATPQDSQYNRNPAYFAHGGNIGVHNYKMDQGGNVEVEGQEMLQIPNGLAEPIYGPPHSQGGIDMQLPQGTKVFSEKLKDPKTKKSYAQMAKPYSTEKDVKNLKSKFTDKIGKATADLNIKLKNENLDELFQKQEIEKLTGLHGSTVQQEAMMAQGYMKNGGQLPEMSGGGQADNWIQQKFATKQGQETPKGGNLNDNPLFNWEGARQMWEQKAREAGALGAKDRFKKTEDLQEFAYDWALDNDPSLIRDMYKQWGVTNKNEARYKDYDVNNLSDQQLKDLRGNFIDNYRGKRMFFPRQTPASNPQNPTQPRTSPPAQKQGDQLGPETEFDYRKATQGQNPNYMDLMGGFNIPGNYAKAPISTSSLTPEYIDPRYLNIQPQLNQVQRGYNAFKSNLGSRTSADVANLLQAQTNAYNQNEQIYGQKYNYDRGQDSQAQQFNAQANMKIDQLNQAELNNFTDKIYRRDGALDIQMRKDSNQALKNDMLRRDYAQAKHYINSTFMPNATDEPWNPYYSSSQPQKEKEKEKDKPQGKHGGKIKLNLKKKLK
jgi:hypothetical protein